MIADCGLGIADWKTRRRALERIACVGFLDTTIRNPQSAFCGEAHS
jgi:hypothetical protein